MINTSGPGFQGLYAGDTIEFAVPNVRVRRGMAHFVPTLARAAVCHLLVFPDHVVVDHGPNGYPVNATNFLRLVRRGKRHIAADKAAAEVQS